MNKELCILFAGTIEEKDTILKEMSSVIDSIETMWIESKHNSEPLLMSRYGLFKENDIGIFVHIFKSHHDYIFNSGCR